MKIIQKKSHCKRSLSFCAYSTAVLASSVQFFIIHYNYQCMVCIFNFNLLGKLFLVICVFCAFCQKVLDISRLAVRSHSLCFVMVSTLKTLLNSAQSAVKDWAQTHDGNHSSRYPLLPACALFCSMAHTLSLSLSIRISSALPLVRLPSAHSN